MVGYLLNPYGVSCYPSYLGDLNLEIKKGFGTYCQGEKYERNFCLTLYYNNCLELVNLFIVGMCTPMAGYGEPIINTKYGVPALDQGSKMVKIYVPSSGETIDAEIYRNEYGETIIYIPGSGKTLKAEIYHDMYGQPIIYIPGSGKTIRPEIYYEEVVGAKITYVLPPGEYVIVYARYSTPSPYGYGPTVVDVAMRGIYPTDAVIKRFRVVDPNHAEVLDSWSCSGYGCRDIEVVFRKMCAGGGASASVLPAPPQPSNTEEHKSQESNPSEAPAISSWPHRSYPYLTIFPFSLLLKRKKQ
jgi:hypothetical protein